MNDSHIRISEAFFVASSATAVVTLFLAWVTPAVVDWIYLTSVWNAASIFLFELAVVATATKIAPLSARLNRARPGFKYALMLAPSVLATVPTAYLLLRKTEWAALASKSLLAPAVFAASVLLTLLLGIGIHLVVDRTKLVWSWTLLMGISTLILIAIRTSGILLPKPGDGSVPLPTVALLVVDTLRADAVSEAGGTKAAKAVNFFSFAQAGIECKNVYAASSWTPPSHAVLFTGTPFYSGNERMLGSDNQTLAESFKDAGYVTVGVSANPTLRADNGFAQGFGLYLNVSEHSGLQYNPFGAVLVWVRSRTTQRTYPKAVDVSRITRKILERYGDSPLFLFVNYMDAHDPYLPSQEAIADYPQLDVEDLQLGVLRRPGWSLAKFMKFDADRLTAQQIEKLKTLYRACITDWDAGFALLLDTLRLREDKGPSLIAVTSDHGEVFGENGGFFTHKNQLLLGELEIPLVVGGSVIPSNEG